jgi:hypothetical protein
MDLAEIFGLGKAQKRGHISRYGLFFVTKPQPKSTSKPYSFYLTFAIYKLAAVRLAKLPIAACHR